MGNPWKTLKKNILYQNRFGYLLRDDDVLTPAGKPGKYMVLEGSDYAMIVALTSDNKLIVVRQWKYPLERETLELPAGRGEEGENLLDTAKRELQEEAGATSDQWEKLTEYWVGSGAFKMRAHVFLARNVQMNRPTQHEETESIKVELLDFDKAVDMIVNREIDEEKTILGVLLAKEVLAKKK